MSLIQCPECGKDVSSRAAACPNCAAPIATHDPGKDKGSDTITHTRSALAQNELNTFGWSALVFQHLAIGAGVGFYYESWYWFFGIVLGGVVISAIPFLGKLMAITLSLGWAILGARFAAGATGFDQTAMWVAGGIIFVLALGVNFAGVQYIADISKD
jgi:hypothetical protein